VNIAILDRAPYILAVAIYCFFAVLLSGCVIFDREYVSTEKIPVILGPKPTPAGRWQNACVVETEQQLRSVGRRPVIHDFWYQTSSLDLPFYPPNLTQKGLLSMNRCHIQGTSRLRADGYMVFSANSQDRPLGEGKRAWAINSCPSLPTTQGGGAHLFVADLGVYKSKSGYAWGDKSSSSDESVDTPVDNRIVKSVLLSTDENVQPPDVGSLTELYHPGGIAGVGDFIYVGFDGEDHTSYLKILDMADPASPVLVGGRGFADHKTQALGATALADGRVLLAVVDTNTKDWKIHFYIEARDPGTKEIDRHRFIKAGTWEESEEIGKRSQKGFPFLKYQSLALLRECGSDDIYLVGVHNDRRLRCGGLFEVPGISTPTRVDLYKLHLPDVMGPNAKFVVEQILRRNMKDQNGEGCAGATAHVTPQGQIVAYTIEHGGSRQVDAGSYPGGLKRWVGKIRFYEYSTRVVMASLDDGDNVSQAEDLCPDEAEDIDGFNDGDGCPDADNDADGIADINDLCPNRAEDSDGINDGDGCAEADDEGFFGNRIVISQQKMFSSTDDFAISNAGLFLATGLVNWWREYGKGDVCVLAHTNNYGDPVAEQAETDRWAKIIAEEFVNLGVPRHQIRAEGFGSRQPVVAPADFRAESLNVRIEFTQCVI